VTDNGGTANGGANTSTPQAFTITVNNINDPPTFTASNPPSINEDAGAQTLNAWATFSPGPANESAQTNLGYTVVPADPTFFSVQPAVALNGTLTYTVAPNRNGSTTISVTVQDSGGTANGASDTGTRIFTITANAVNDAPTLTASNPPASNEDSGAQTVAAWASFNPGPADEAAQTATYSVSVGATTGNLAFSAAPSVAANGTLTYTATANTSGTAQITVTVTDNGGTANGGVNTSAPQVFTITVNGINDAPSFNAANPPGKQRRCWRTNCRRLGLWFHPWPR
jgi:hypothetical protein